MKSNVSIWFQRTQFFGSWLLVGLEGADLTTQVSWCVCLKCQKEKQLKITTNCWEDLAWRLRFPLLALLHALFSLKSPFKHSILRQRWSALRSSVCPQTTSSFLWRPLFAQDYRIWPLFCCNDYIQGSDSWFQILACWKRIWFMKALIDVDQNTHSSVFMLFTVELYGLVLKYCL